MSSEYSRVTGILSFYDEPIELLAACVSGMCRVVDHVVAIDGSYLLYPNGQPSSDPQQMRIIEEICRGSNVGITTHTQTQRWHGNEVQKRNHALRLAEAVTSPEGWYLVLDADCVVTYATPMWFETVAAIPEDFGAAMIDVNVVQTIPGIELEPDDAYQPVRLMYRALRRMVYGPAHWIIHAPDPETNEPICFWGPNELEPVEAFDLTSYLKIDHRLERPEYRRVAGRKYYVMREKLGIENYEAPHR